MNDLIAAGGVLARVLERENAALAGMTFGELGPLVAEKAEAVAGFTSAQEAAGPVVPPAGHAQLAALHEKLTGLMTENRRLLARGLATQSELVEVIARLVAEDDPLASYGPPAPRRPAPLAVSARA